MSTKATDTSGLLRQAVKEIGDEFLERREETEMLIITLLARQNAFLLGEPGTGKSALVRRVCAILEGGVYMDLLFDKQLPLADIFGQYDLVGYKNNGVWRRDPTGRLPQAHIFFGDEVGKSGPAVTNSLLTAINEHAWHDGSGKAVPIPLLMHVGASNEELEMPEQAALWDRYGTRKQVMPIQEPGNFQSLLWSAVEKKTKKAPTTVSLRDLLVAIEKDVPAVELPAGIIAKVMQLKSDLRAENQKPSDRRWKSSMRLLQAAAYLGGRTSVDEDDLLILKHVMWDSLEFAALVEVKVMNNASATAKWALTTQSEVLQHETRLDGVKGQSKTEQAAVAADINHKLSKAEKDYLAKLAEATEEGRSTVRLEQINDQIQRIRVRVAVELMGMPEDRARKRFLS